MSTSYFTTTPLVDGMLRSGADPQAAARYGLSTSASTRAAGAGRLIQANLHIGRRPIRSERAHFLIASLWASPFLALPIWSALS